MNSQLPGLRRPAGVLALLLVAACGQAAAPGDAPEPTAQTSDSLRHEVARLSAVLDDVSASVGRLQTSLGEPDRVSPAGAGRTTRAWGLRVVAIVLILAITALLLRALDAVVPRGGERRLFPRRMVPVARLLAWAVAFAAISLVIFGLSGQGLIAAIVVAGLVFGFAARDFLANLVGGLVLGFDPPFHVGDHVRVGGVSGRVVSIGLHSTRIDTADDGLVTVPNARVVDGQVSNTSSGSLECQVVTDLYLPGWVDEALAKRVAHQVAASSRYVHLQKPIVVLVRDEFRETFVTHLRVKAYVIDARYQHHFMSDVTERARAEFRRHGLLGPLHGARATVELSPWGRAQVASDERSADVRAP